MRRAAFILLAVLACGAASARTQQEMNATEGAKLGLADKALNAVYARLMAKISPPGQSALREAQRLWVNFRDRECEFETLGSAGGSVHPMVVAACLTRVTQARTVELKAQLDCPEGDVGCGNQ